MTTTRQHIEDLDAAQWAALTRHAAVAASEAAQRLGRNPPAEVAAVAARSERELVEHRARAGAAPTRLSAVMRLVAADHLRVVAETAAREADQNRLDAEATAAIARDEAAESDRIASVAREEARAAEARAAGIERERAAAAVVAQQALEEVRAALERARAETEAELATAREQVSAAQARAEERIAERAEDKAAAEQACSCCAASWSGCGPTRPPRLLRPVSRPVPPRRARSSG